MKVRLWRFLSHGNIVLGVMFVVFYVLDRLNPAMEFLTSDLSRGLLLVFCLCAVAQGILSTVHLHKAAVEEWEEAQREQQQEQPPTDKE